MQHSHCPCCRSGLPAVGPRVCPECGHSFRGNGWDGIDAHWRSKHGDVAPYESFWTSLCPAHRGRPLQVGGLDSLTVAEAKAMLDVIVATDRAASALHRDVDIPALSVLKAAKKAVLERLRACGLHLRDDDREAA